jgi:hypothetical protein
MIYMIGYSTQQYGSIERYGIRLTTESEIASQIVQASAEAKCFGSATRNEASLDPFSLQLQPLPHHNVNANPQR